MWYDMENSTVKLIFSIEGVTMAIENGTEVRVVVPKHLYQRLQHDADRVSVPVASMVRVILAGHYGLLANQQEAGGVNESPAAELAQVER